MLNAFRHHGLYRRQCLAVPADDPPDLCSTPFGITDYIGGPPGQRCRWRARVLNAFRHHGLYRTPCLRGGAAEAAGAQRLSASRIISVGFVPDARPPSATSCAQRLSASRIISARPPYPPGAPVSLCAQRLSASRIISAPARGRAASSTHSCAQRLSASRIISAPPPGSPA